MDRFQLPLYNEIPDVGLYLEQVQRFAEDKLKPLKDVSITSSMISNYVKQSIIRKPVKKLYYRDQIAEIIFVAIAKTVMSLDDIRGIMEIHRNESETGRAYEYFRRGLTEKLEEITQGQKPDVHASEPSASIDSENAYLMNQIFKTIAYKLYLDDLLGKRLGK